MKSITVCQQTTVGSMKVTFEVKDEIYSYVIEVLSGKVTPLTVTVTQGDETEQ